VLAAFALPARRSQTQVYATAPLALPGALPYPKGLSTRGQLRLCSGPSFDWPPHPRSGVRTFLPPRSLRRRASDHPAHPHSLLYRAQPVPWFYVLHMYRWLSFRNAILNVRGRLRRSEQVPHHRSTSLPPASRTPVHPESSRPIPSPCRTSTPDPFPPPHNPSSCSPTR